MKSSFLFRFFFLLLVMGLCPLAGAAEATADFSSLVLRGFDLEKRGQYREAYEEYSAAIRLREDSPTAYVRRAFCAAKIGQLERSAFDLREACILQPVSMTDYTTLAWLLATSPVKRVRDGTRAVAYAQKALVESESLENYDILAAAYAEMSNFQQARQFLMTGMKKFPDSPRMPEVRARLELYNKKQPYREEWLAAEDQKKLQQNVEYPKER